MNKVLKELAALWCEWKQMWIGWRVERMKRKADRLREATGSQMFVVKMDGKIRIVSKRWFKDKRQRGMFPKHFTAERLKRIAFYYTRP
ncbi:MAG: hypothetical protein FWG22_03850 [Prolixibacteraceae bacterium]|nr:hypothetical protein [Prolixibacteraceae bacterium]